MGMDMTGMIVIVAVRMVVIVPVAVRVHGIPHRELRCRDTGPKHALGADVETRERQASERALQLVEGQARIDEGAKDHVA